MKQLSLLVFLFSFFVSFPAYGSDRLVIDFRDGEFVRGGEPVSLIDLIEHRGRGYAGERITDVIVYADSSSRRRGSQVQLLDDRRRIISEDTLSGGSASLPVYEEYQRAAYLYFEGDVYLNRLEFVTERHPRGFERRREREELRPLKQKGFLVPKGPLEIGSFVKSDYTSEVKKFTVPSGGYSAINFRVQIGEQHAVIVNSILVLSNGKKLGWKTVGARLSSGDNEFALNVPEEATDVQVTFAHGQGSSVQVYLLP